MPRAPSRLSPERLVETGGEALGVEIRAEKAAALGRAERALEQALARLRAENDGPERARLFAVSADAAHALIIQRELTGFRGEAEVVERYAVPRAVAARIGVR